MSFICGVFFLSALFVHICCCRAALSRLFRLNGERITIEYAVQINLNLLFMYQIDYRAHIHKQQPYDVNNFPVSIM